MKKIILFSILINSYLISVNADQLFNEGKKIFINQGNCASCHALSDAKSNGNIGPNLNQIRPTKDRVIAAVTRGIGVMPAYEDVLTFEEIDAVAYYVSVASQK